jgi:hypothetical protein
VRSAGLFLVGALVFLVGFAAWDLSRLFH